MLSIGFDGSNFGLDGKRATSLPPSNKPLASKVSSTAAKEVVKKRASALLGSALRMAGPIFSAFIFAPAGPVREKIELIPDGESEISFRRWQKAGYIEVLKRNVIPAQAGIQSSSEELEVYEDPANPDPTKPKFLESNESEENHPISPRDIGVTISSKLAEVEDVPDSDTSDPPSAFEKNKIRKKLKERLKDTEDPIDKKIIEALIDYLNNFKNRGMTVMGQAAREADDGRGYYELGRMQLDRKKGRDYQVKALENFLKSLEYKDLNPNLPSKLIRRFAVKILSSQLTTCKKDWNVRWRKVVQLVDLYKSLDRENSAVNLLNKTFVEADAAGESTIAEQALDLWNQFEPTAKIEILLKRARALSESLSSNQVDSKFTAVMVKIWNLVSQIGENKLGDSFNWFANRIATAVDEGMDLSVTDYNIKLTEAVALKLSIFKKTGDALMLLDKGLAIAPKNPNFLGTKGFALRRSNKTKAKKLFKQALDNADELNPIFRANCYGELGLLTKKSNKEDANENFSDAIEADPQNPRWYLEKAKIQINWEHNENALENIDKAIELEKEHRGGVYPNTLEVKARLLKEMGHLPEAVLVLLETLKVENARGTVGGSKQTLTQLRDNLRDLGRQDDLARVEARMKQKGFLGEHGGER